MSQSLHQVAKVLEFQIQHQFSNKYSGLISFRMDWLDLLVVQGTLESSPTPQFRSISSLALSFLYGPTLTSIHDSRKNHSLDIAKPSSLAYSILYAHPQCVRVLIAPYPQQR